MKSGAPAIRYYSMHSISSSVYIKQFAYHIWQGVPDIKVYSQVAKKINLLLS